MYFATELKEQKRNTETRRDEIEKEKQRIKLGFKEAIYTKMTRYLFPRKIFMNKKQSRRPPISVIQILQKKRLINFLAKFKSHHLSNED